MAVPVEVSLQKANAKIAELSDRLKSSGERGRASCVASRGSVAEFVTLLVLSFILGVVLMGYVIKFQESGW